MTNRDFAPHETEIEVTAARGAERRGIYRILLISTVLAVVVIGLAWLAISSHAYVSPTHVGPGPTPATSSQ
jgi:hypothetical protein